jgi:hypothetical protein
MCLLVHSSCLLVYSSLDGAEDGGDFTLQDCEVEVDDAAAGMEHDVDRAAQQRQVTAHGLAHSALDTIAVDGLA